MAEYQYKYSRTEVENGIPQTKKYQGVTHTGDKYSKLLDGHRKQIIFVEDMKDWILDYYADTNNPAALRGRDALFAAIKHKYTGISRRDIGRVRM